MKRLLITIALACVLSASALAGEIPTSGVPAPQPSGMTQTSNTLSAGDVPSVGHADQLSNAALSAWLTVLGLLVA